MTNTEPQYAVIYCRVSSPSQVARGHGLEGQEARCRAHAATHGYVVEAVFPDDVTGGGDFMKRPGMMALLAYLDAQPDKNYVIIFDDLKRFARDIDFHRALRRELDTRGARPECLNFKFDDSPEGEFVEIVVAATGELERKQNRRQVIQKMKARAEAGYWLFGKPFGYRYENVPGHGRMLVRNEPAATVIASALERYASGQLATYTELQRYLNANPAIKGKTHHGGIKMDTAKALLTRPVYAGYVHVPSWGLNMVKGAHEPLISLATYQAIQNRQNTLPVAPVRKDTQADFPLRGFIACAECGHAMTAAHSKGRSRYYPYYFCCQAGCSQRRKNIRGETLHDAFENFLAKLRPHQQLLELMTDLLREAWQERAERAKDEAKAAQSKLAQLNAEIERTVSKAVSTNSELMQERYESRVAELENKRALLDEQAATIGTQKTDLDGTIRTALDFLSNPLKLWKSERLEDRNLTLRLVFASPLAYCREKGIRTANLTLPFKVLAGFFEENTRMVGDPGIEPGVRLREGVTVPCHTLRPVAHCAIRAAAPDSVSA